MDSCWQSMVPDLQIRLWYWERIPKCNISIIRSIRNFWNWSLCIVFVPTGTVYHDKQNQYCSMTGHGNIFHITSHFCRDPWIPTQRFSNAELWSFLCQAIEQTIESPVKWTILTPIWRHCNAIIQTIHICDPFLCPKVYPMALGGNCLLNFRWKNGGNCRWCDVFKGLNYFKSLAIDCSFTNL